MICQAQAKSERVGRQLASWSCLLGGFTLLAMTLLTPPWYRATKLDLQRDIIRFQAEQLDAQHQAYRRVLDAIKTDDPLILEYLAFDYLSLKPINTELIETLTPASESVARRPFPDTTPVAQSIEDSRIVTRSGSREPRRQRMTIEHRLHRPLDRVKKSNLATRWDRSRLVEIATGPGRRWPMVGGGLCLLFSLWITVGSTDRKR